MGLGIGVYCELCKEQLYYGKDTAEIIWHTQVDANGTQTSHNHPVMCHECTTAINRLQWYNEQKMKHDYRLNRPEKCL